MDKMPWEKPENDPLEGRLEKLQRDMGTMITYTCVVVFSSHGELDGLRMNVARGSAVPPGQSIYQDGTVVELRDIGMPQPGAQFGTVADLVRLVAETAQEEGLQL